MDKKLIIVIIVIITLMGSLIYRCMTNQNYRVSWVSNITGETGHGKRAFSKETAQDICDRGNRKYPELNHWLE